MDGIDLAALRTDGHRNVERGPSMFVAYDAAFRARIEAGLVTAKRIKERSERPGDLAGLEQELTHRHADAVTAFLARYGEEWTPEIIGFHGQTVLHRPLEALTVQLGDGQVLARETKIPVVYDMRAEDMRFGGQGAPLVPIYHAALGSSLPKRWQHYPVCFVNIGGISNITYIPKTGDPVAFDSGPGNALIDQWVLAKAGIPYDEDGRIASEGSVVRSVVEHYLDNPFFNKPGPKSLDRNDFDLEGVEGLALDDGARTLAAVTAEAIMRANNHLEAPVKLWIVCGGGRKNPHIINDMLTLAKQNNALVEMADEVALDGDSMEAEAWAYLAVRSLEGMPLTFPSTTGCSHPVTGGVLAHPA